MGALHHVQRKVRERQSLETYYPLLASCVYLRERERGGGVIVFSYKELPAGVDMRLLVIMTAGGGVRLHVGLCTFRRVLSPRERQW